MSGQIRGVRFVLALGVALLAAAAPAHALTCNQDETLSQGTGTFTDCAGRSVSYSLDDFLLTLSHQGVSDLNEWFSDLHISFENTAGLSGDFQNQSVGVSWSTSTMNDNTIWFVANQGSDRADPGDAYNWQVFASFFDSGQSTRLLNIRYTMDVPEPGLAILGLGALAGLLLVRRRAA